MTQEKITKKEVLIDLEGTANNNDFERPFIPEDSYNFKIIGVNRKDMPTFSDKEKKEPKLILSLELQDQSISGNSGKIFQHFLSPVIKKSGAGKTSTGTTYSNSKLYDLLVDLGLKEKTKLSISQLETLDGLQLFLSQELVGKIVRASVKTVNANTEKAYSKVQKILRFISQDGEK